MWLASEPLVRGAAPTGRHRRCRCCRVAARSWLRPPTADCARRERSLRSVLVRSRGDYGMVTPTSASAPDTARVFSTARIARWEVAARNRLRSRSGFAVPRRAPTAVGGRSQARCCTCAALSAVGDRRASVDDHWAGLPVTQCRPWPAEDVWSEARAAPALCTGAGKRAERFPAASSRPAIRPC